MSTYDERVTEAIQQALTDILGHGGELVVTRWTLSVERHDGGGRDMAYFASESMMAWEVLGMTESMAEHARVTIQSDAVSDIYAGSDDDDDDE